MSDKKWNALSEYKALTAKQRRAVLGVLMRAGNKAMNMDRKRAIRVTERLLGAYGFLSLDRDPDARR